MLDLKKIETMIRTEEDPEKIARDLKAMIEEAYPAQEFTGEEIPMHEFIDRFWRVVCWGNATLFLQWPVRVKTERQPDGAVELTLTTSWRHRKW